MWREKNWTQVFKYERCSRQRPPLSLCTWRQHFKSKVLQYKCMSTPAAGCLARRVDAASVGQRVDGQRDVTGEDQRALCEEATDWSLELGVVERVIDAKLLPLKSAADSIFFLVFVNERMETGISIWIITCFATSSFVSYWSWLVRLKVDTVFFYVSLCLQARYTTKLRQMRASHTFWFVKN